MPAEPLPPFHRKHIFLTGASGGLGRAVARGLARQGAFVSLFARHAAKLGRVGRELEELGGRYILVPGSVTRPVQVAASLLQAEAKLGPIDTVIHCAAALARRCEAVDLPTAHWEEVIATNLHGSFVLCQAVLRLMLPRKAGTIVLINSTSGSVGRPGYAAYAASKWGLRGLTASLQEEVRGSGVRVCSVAPGALHRRQKEGGQEVLEYADAAEWILAAAALPPRASLRESVLIGTSPESGD